MAILNEDVLFKDVRTKHLPKICFIFGNDSYLKHHYCQKISEIACTGDPFFNLQKFENECNLQDVYDAVKQYPMMAESKLVNLSDFDFLKCGKEDFDKLLKIISEVEEGCVLLLDFMSVQFDVKKDSRFKKITALIEKSGGKVYCLDHRSEQKLARMLVVGAKNRGCELADSDALFMIRNSGSDISLLKNELDKLCLFVKSGKISRDLIEKMTVKTVDASLYDYAGLIISGDLAGALKMLDDFFFMRIEPMVILYSVSSLYIDLYRAFEAQNERITADKVAEDFSYGARKFVVKNAMRSLKNFDFYKLNKSFSVILKTDSALKSFSVSERQILEEMTVKLFTVLWGGK